MLKRLFATFLLVMACTLPVFNTEAANWIKIGETDDGINHYIDTDSYNYSKSENIVKCWVKVDNPKENISTLGYEFFNLTDKTMGIKSSVQYENGSVVSNDNSTYVEYIPVIPGSFLEVYYNVLANFAFMDNANIDWEFNKLFIPAPSELGSDNWVPITENKIWMDKTSLNNDNPQYSASWFLFDNDKYYTMQYNLINNNSNAIVNVKQILYQKDNTKLFEVTYPALVWPKANNLSKDEFTAMDNMHRAFAHQ